MNPYSLPRNQRKTGEQKLCNNGWFMAIDPASGLIIAVQELQQPENNKVALDVLHQVISCAPKVDCVIYDRACRCEQQGRRDECAAHVKHWCVDRFHAKGHADGCLC